ncbi:MAG: hypothetical protein Q9163_000350 [Psora crenata]
MCIAIFSTAHPEYALILISNRDEFLSRPTLQADWWEPPHSNILGGRDLLRAEQGTWLGITREGRIAVLTNVREEGNAKPEARSRGAVANAFLMQPADSQESTEDFVRSLVAQDGMEGIGGFNVVCGRAGEPLAVISNRTPNADSITWVAKEPGETIGLSNAVITDRSWTKITRGEAMMAEVIHKNSVARESKGDLIEALLGVLQNDTLPCNPGVQNWGSKVKELRKSIFIPALGEDGARIESAANLASARQNKSVQAENPDEHQPMYDGLSGAYGTQKQTILLVTQEGRVTFLERTLYGANGMEVAKKERDKYYEFDIESLNWLNDNIEMFGVRGRYKILRMLLHDPRSGRKDMFTLGLEIE